MPTDVTIEPLTSTDRDALLRLDQSAFAFDDRAVDPEPDTAVIEWDRAWGASHDGELAGIYVVFSFGLTVPGMTPAAATVVPMAGLSWVAVHPDHRRHGVLRAMVSHHLSGVRDAGRGEAVSCLFASEAGIYGRFGYGLSTQSCRLTLPAHGALRPLADPGHVRTRFESLDRDRHVDIIDQVYDAACLLRPGHVVRPPGHRERQLADEPGRRPGGAEALKVIVAERGGVPTGYALLRRTSSWGEHRPEGTVSVSDMHALDGQSAHAIWRRLLDFDLMAEMTSSQLALDDPLLVWAGETGSTIRSGHSLWTRLVDVGAALAGRGYSSAVDVVLDISDEGCPWNAGRWRLAADAGGARCEQTTAAPDLSLDVRELGSAYLGGVTLVSLGSAGLVHELTPGALAACSAALRSPALPATPYMF